MSSWYLHTCWMELTQIQLILLNYLDKMLVVFWSVDIYVRPRVYKIFNLMLEIDYILQYYNLKFLMSSSLIRYCQNCARTKKMLDGSSLCSYPLNTIELTGASLQKLFSDCWEWVFRTFTAIPSDSIHFSATRRKRKSEFLKRQGYWACIKQ